VSQNNGVDVTEYLIDQQASLAVVLRQKIGSQNTNYVHGLRGIQSQVANSAWSEAMNDGLCSVRGWLNSSRVFGDIMNDNPHYLNQAVMTGSGLYKSTLSFAVGVAHCPITHLMPQ